MKSCDRILLAYAALMAVVVAAFAIPVVQHFATDACKTLDRAELAKSGLWQASCFEFWLNRYQQLVAAALAIIAAAGAAIPVYIGLKHSAQQASIQAAETLERRSQMIEADFESLRGLRILFVSLCEEQDKFLYVEGFSTNPQLRLIDQLAEKMVMEIDKNSRNSQYFEPLPTGPSRQKAMDEFRNYCLVIRDAFSTDFRKVAQKPSLIAENVSKWNEFNIEKRTLIDEQMREYTNHSRTYVRALRRRAAKSISDAIR